MYDDGSAAAGGILAVVFGVMIFFWLFALAWAVWYFWALSRLFPYLGLPGVHGWIPIFNIWRLVERGGYPGWMAIIPGLNVVIIIMAIHRINTEHGEGTGMTVLGFFLVPVWAMVLRSHLKAKGYAPHIDPPGTVYGAAQPGQGFQGAPRGTVEYGPNGQAYPVLGAQAPAAPAGQPAPAAPNYAMPPAPMGSAPVAPSMPPAPPAPAAPTGPSAPAAPAAPNGGMFAAPPAPTGGTFAQPQFQQPQAMPPAPSMPPAPPAPPAPQVQAAPPAPAAPPAAPPVAPPAAPSAPAPSAPSGQGGTPWALGDVVNGDFERLANEDAPSRDGSFGSSKSDARPFSWPEPDPQRAQAPLPPAPPAPSAPPVAPAPPAPPAPPAVSAPPAAPPAPPAPPAQAPEPVRAPEPVSAPEPAPVSEPDEGPEDDVAATVVTGSAPGSAAPISAPVSPIAPAAADAADAGSDDEELDRTIVVARKAPWVLELSDGRELELVGDDIVLGRKPAAIDGSEILVVPDATRTLSKSHARLRREGDGWTIEDLGSTNGVFVFDERGLQVELEPGKPQPASEELILGTLEVKLREAN